MYSIEYYKTKRKRPEWMLEEAHIENFKTEHDYKLHVAEQKLRNACWDIKSLTIDTEDLLILDDTIWTTSCLSPLCDWAKYNDVKRVTIINNDTYNEEIIYDIINASWLINVDKFEYSDEYIIERIIKLNNLLSRVETIEDEKKKRIYKKEIIARIKQLKYYCYQSEKLKHEEKEESQVKTKKFGTKEMKRLLD